MTRCLARMGVPRSTAYRWEARCRWLVESGPQELRELQREREELLAEVARLREAQARCGRTMTPREEWGLILEGAVLANSNEEVAALLSRAGGRSLSHETIRATLAAALPAARVVCERHFVGVGTVAAGDEMYAEGRPLLLLVEPLSLAISGGRLAEECTAEAWKPVFEQMGELAACGADGGRALGEAAADAGVPVHADMFHLLRPASTALARLERSYGPKRKALAKAERAVEQARFRGGRDAGRLAGQRRRRAREAAERVVEEYCRLGDLLERVRGAFGWTTPDGRVQTAQEARATVAEAIEAMKTTREGRPVAQEVERVERCEAAFAHLEALEAALSGLRLEQVGPDRAAKLGKLVEDTVAWRRRDKEPVEILEQASNGSLADAVEIAVIKAVDRAIRSSSYVECVNSRIRLVQVARKRLSEGFVYLLMVYHNMKPFGRGSVRAGKSPAELAGIELPTKDWIELLAMTAKELAATAEAAA